eukprot:TRINITY_DN9547_c0_g1_i1.p1 TRINITY_DN9547_c0_g1~~TRINITY_DN9547_c0_g1_i1.p1  ORF type:complete len:233 (+),score=29.66 TRINITY_DN9547_c0_g1_i1:310-1008(+)
MMSYTGQSMPIVGTPSEINSPVFIYISIHGMFLEQQRKKKEYFFTESPKHSQDHQEFCRNGSKEIFTVPTISELKLVGSKVILDASSTSFRSTIPSCMGGEPLIQSFLRSGASCIVVPLWTVDAETFDTLITYFISYLLNGFTVPEALRMSQLNMGIQSINVPDWGSVISIGNTEALPTRDLSAGSQYFIGCQYKVHKHNHSHYGYWPDFSQLKQDICQTPTSTHHLLSIQI